MKFNRKAIDLANDLRERVQKRTATIDDGESVAILLWWSFICDHAKCHGLKPEELAKAQLDAFTKYAVDAGIDVQAIH